MPKFGRVVGDSVKRYDFHFCKKKKKEKENDWDFDRGWIESVDIFG